MARFGKNLEKEQLFLGNIVDSSTYLFAMSCCIGYANAQDKAHQVDLARIFCEQAETKIKDNFTKLWSHNQRRIEKKLSKSILNGDLMWLEEGI